MGGRLRLVTARSWTKLSSEPIAAMKRILILSLSTILANAAFGADEPTPPPILQPGKDYALAFLENARISMNGPVRVLSHPQNGWVRIEYTPIRAAPPGVAPENPPAKRQVWLNLTHIITIQEWDAAAKEREQRKAERAKQ